MYDLELIGKSLKRKLKRERYIHTQGVMYTAAALAMRYEADIQRAMTAGLLHDCGKFCSSSDQVEYCRKYRLELTQSELSMPALVHAKLGAYLAEHEYGVKERDILDAITYHTTGRPDMSLLEKIIYIADYIEPWRGNQPWLNEVREMAFRDIDRAVAKCAGLTISYLERNNRPVEPMTMKTSDFYGPLE